MKTITVNKAHLIATITQNRDAHREQFLAAQKKFREKVIESLDFRLREARAGRHVDIAVRLPEPVDYTDSYDTALEMLAWEQSETIALDRTDFERYVQNNWEWRQHWAANTQSYLAE